MAGYQRQDINNNIANGNVIDADDFDNEFNALEDAFNASTGHNHDGSPGGGATISSIGPSSDLVVTATAIKGKLANTLDIGTTTVPFKNGYFDGTLNTDILSVDETSTFTGVATFNGGLSGNLTGNLIGDVYSTDGTSKVLESGTNGTDAAFTGNVTGDVQGNIINSDFTTIFNAGSDSTAATYYGNIINANNTPILTPGSSLVTAQFEGNANTADAWSTPRTISFGGAGSDVTGSFQIDGSGDITDVELSVTSVSVPAGSVTLGTDTTGSYVETLAVDSTITRSNAAPTADGAQITLSIGQAVGTTDNVTFSNVTANKFIGDVYKSDGTTKVVDTVNTLFNGTVSSLSNHNTDDLAEAAIPVNKYFTDARARGAVSASNGVQYSSSTGVFSHNLTQGTGISISVGGTITNTAPDKTVTFNDSGSVSVTGTYPNFNITATDTTYTEGTGISISASNQISCTIDSPSEVGLSSLYNNGNSVTGSFTASGNITAYSDERLKSDIERISGALAKVQAIRGVNFTMTATGDRGTGVIAQEVQAQIPEAVQVDDSGFLSVAYGNLVGLLIEAVKELSDEVQSLKQIPNPYPGVQTEADITAS